MARLHRQFDKSHERARERETFCPSNRCALTERQTQTDRRLRRASWIYHFQHAASLSPSAHNSHTAGLQVKTVGRHFTGQHYWTVFYRTAFYWTAFYWTPLLDTAVRHQTANLPMYVPNVVCCKQNIESFLLLLFFDLRSMAGERANGKSEQKERVSKRVQSKWSSRKWGSFLVRETISVSSSFSKAC